MWETWREEMRHWGQQQWSQWYAEHERRRVADREQGRRDAVEQRHRIKQKWQRSGDWEQDWKQHQELERQDDLEHPEIKQRKRERERQQSTRQQEVLAYPALALRRHADLRNPDGPSSAREPMTIGFGPTGEALALWQDGDADADRAVIHRHSPDGRLDRIIPLPAQTHRGSVQPLPGGEVLLVSHRCRRKEYNADVYDESGELVRTAHLGDGIAHVLSTAGGAVWTSYFDEGVFSRGGLGNHGLIRFGPDLSAQWLYPNKDDGDLPYIADCYALNVEGEKAWSYAYTEFHLASVEGEQALDHGPVPFRGAHAVLIDGDRAAVIGGYEGERHVITPLHLTSEGLQLAAPPQRLVLPDGAPMPAARYSGRGSQLHVAVGATWYRLDLDQIIAS